MKQKMRSLKILLSELYEFKPMIFLSILGSIIVEAVLPLSQLLLSAWVIEWLIEGIAIRTYLIRLLGMIAGIAILQMTQNFLEFEIEEKRSQFRVEIHDKIVKKSLLLDYPLLMGKEAQEKYNQANALTDNDQTLFGRIMPEIVQFASSLVAVALFIGILSQLDQVLLLLVGAFLLFVLLFNYLQQKMDRRLFAAKAANSQKMSYLRRVYGESGITKDIRIFQMNEWFQQLEQNTIKEYHHFMKPKVRLSWMESTVLNIGIIGLSALSFIRSVQLIQTGVIPLASFVVYAGSVSILTSTIIAFISASGKLGTSLDEMEKYEDFMSQKQVFNHGKGCSLPAVPVSIELKNVTYTYPNSSKPVIKNLSLKIAPFEKLAIVGENGAGKSTLINLIAGLLKPDSGEILINGVQQEEYNIKEYYTLFAPVFQENYLLTYSIKDTVLQGMPFEEHKYKKVLEQSGLDKVIQNFETGDATKIVRAVHADAVTLSGGQLQKLKLAQALYKDAPVLILDEPTSALDPIAERQIYEDYVRFSDRKLSIFISHRLSSTRFCDRVIYIQDGQISEEGSHDELLKNKKGYYRLYEAQAYYYKNQTDHAKVEQSEELNAIGGVL